MKNMVELSHAFLKPVLHPGALCLDGTLGSGKDTRFFLNRGVRKVLAFEIQPEAAQAAEARLNEPDRLEVVVRSHEYAKEYAEPESVDAAIFNFGYCPGLENGAQTTPEASLKGVQAALKLLRPKGRMALVFYPHERAEEEAATIEAFLKAQDPHRIAVQKIVQFNATKAPFLLLLEKKKTDET